MVCCSFIRHYGEGFCKAGPSVIRKDRIPQGETLFIVLYSYSVIVAIFGIFLYSTLRNHLSRKLSRRSHHVTYLLWMTVRIAIPIRTIWRFNDFDYGGFD